MKVTQKTFRLSKSILEQIYEKILLFTEHYGERPIGVVIGVNEAVQLAMEMRELQRFPAGLDAPETVHGLPVSVVMRSGIEMAVPSSWAARFATGEIKEIEMGTVLDFHKPEPGAAK